MVIVGLKSVERIYSFPFWEKAGMGAGARAISAVVRRTESPDLNVPPGGEGKRKDTQCLTV